MGAYDNCTSVSPECPIEAELYGYAPNLGANLFFAIVFGLCAIIQVAAGLRYRTRFFMWAVTFGCVIECAGYSGRVIMHYNVWNQIGFQMQISGLIQGPAYLSAGIYLTLKHIVLNLGQQYSRVKASRYTWIFISCDLIALSIQGAGGGIAAAADDGDVLLDVGTDMMIAGIIFQIVALLLFGYFLVEYLVRVFRHQDQLEPHALDILESRRSRCFMMAIVLAYLCIFIRCVYRLPELLGGWGNALMRRELDFNVLEGGMICLATLALTAFHPGWGFPAMAGSLRSNGKDSKPVPIEQERDEKMVDRA